MQARPHTPSSFDVQPVIATVLIGIALAQLFGLDDRLRNDPRQGKPKTDARADGRGLNGTGRRLEAGRGRQADTPAQIPSKGWKDILWRVYGQVQEDRVLLVSAGVTFYLLLAIFPATAAVVSLYGLFADATAINNHLASLAGVLPSGAIDIIGEQVKRIASKSSGTLGFAFFFTLALSLWSANSGMKSIFDALNIVYDETEKRSFIGLNLQSLAVTIAAVVFILLAIGGTVVLPIAFEYLGLASRAESLISIGRWPALLLVTMLALACLYRYGPSRNEPRWEWVSWGAAIATLLWLAGTGLFTWYVTNLGRFNRLYGALGAVVILLLWLLISGHAILLGAEINAEMERQTKKDTT